MDASCSGTTPFKRLTDHQSRDVSHHQDRLTNTHHNPQSFRSQHQQQPQDGFSNFMDSPSALPMNPTLHHDPAGRLNAHAAALQPPTFAVAPQDLSQTHIPSPDVSNWAADFSRFAKQPNQQRRAPIQSHSAAPMQMNFQNAFPQQQHQPGFSSFFAPAGAAYGPQQVAQQPQGEADFDQEMKRWMAANGGGGNMEQVDAAMEQMARELELNEAALAQAEATSEQVDTETATETTHFSDLGVPEIGNLSLENRDAAAVAEQQILNEDEAAAMKGKSAVSEAAERLLESVQHESGEKWQNSVFLSLMRDFRDGKKDIVDNEIVEDENMVDGSEPGPAPAQANT